MTGDLEMARVRTLDMAWESGGKEESPDTVIFLLLLATFNQPSDTYLSEIFLPPNPPPNENVLRGSMVSSLTGAVWGAGASQGPRPSLG